MNESLPDQRPQLDPWEDAAQIAQLLNQSGAELIVAIGAEQWCEKCALLRPKFEQLPAQAGPQRVCLWFDLEDHAEFIGSFIPEDLPLMMRWQNGQCIQIAVITSIQTDQHPPITLRDTDMPDDLPNLWQILTQPNWGS
jgi:thiol-disulfide isomerase/thioredoxin